MAVTNPDWLTQHGGSLRTTPDCRRWLVMLNNEPVYWLQPVPVAGKFGCYIAQTNNGKNLPSAAVADTGEGAVNAGLEDLRKALGW